jgi:DNA-binding transcriptional LysR family regulator
MNSSSLDLNLLLVFDALIIEGSVTRAGARLHLSQPTVSNALTRLRSMLDDPLFVRTRIGMEPTSRALQIHEDVAEALQLIQRGISKGAKFDPMTSDWEIRMVLSDIGEVIYLPKLMHEMKTVAPGVTVAATQLPSDRYASVLESGEVDLVMGYAPQLGPGFHQQRLFDDLQLCLVREGHPRVRGKLSLQGFMEESHVSISPIWSQLNPFEVALRTLKIERRVAIRVGHYLSLPNIVRETDLLGCMPSRAIAAFPSLPGVKVLPLPFSYPAVVMKQFWHRRNHHDPKSRWLRAMVAKVIAEG